MNNKKKWYVVWVGANPGIYENWAECKSQIQGFPNAKYKSFETMAEAQTAFRSSSTQISYAKSSKTIIFYLNTRILWVQNQIIKWPFIHSILQKDLVGL